jgi:hypothetical protein
MKRFPVILIFALAALVVAQPADDGISIQASVNADRIGLEDTLLYTLTFRGINNPVPPDMGRLTDFQLLQTSRSSEFRFTNGVSTYLTHLEYYLKPRREGTLTLPPVRYDHQGREFRSQGITVQVVKGSLGAPAPAANPGFPFGDNFFGRNDEPQAAPAIDLRLQASLSKSRAYVGEGVTYRVQLVTRNAVDSINMLSSGTLPGFWQEWFPLPASISGAPEFRNGVRYQVFEIRKAVLFPSRSGRLTIPALQFEINLSGDPWSLLGTPRKVSRATEELKLEAVALPPAAAGLPVGHFTMEVKPERLQTDINDLLTVRLTISGSGNFKTLPPPVMPAASAYNVYPAKTSSRSDFQTGELTGELEVEYPIAFTAPGRVTLPAIPFAFFDPQTGTVTTLNGPSFAVQVSGRPRTDGMATSGPGRIMQVGEDIAFIRSGRITDQTDHWQRHNWFWALLLLPWAVALAVAGKRYLWDRHLAGSSRFRRRRILADTLGRLRRVRDIGEVGSVLESYMQQKSGMGLAEINQMTIETYCHRHNVPPGDLAVFLTFKAQADQARFAGPNRGPGGTPGDMPALIQAVRRIDRHLP